MISIIAACDENCGIGKDGIIPWNNTKDMRLFRATTLGKTVVMGRKTWDSINNKGLPDRQNAVLTNTTGLRIMKNKNVKIFRTIEFLCKYYNNEFVVIGGQQIYEEFLERDLVDYIMLTAIKGYYGCDTFFPYLYSDRWTVLDTIQISHDAEVLHFIRTNK